jgi:hypothetical protein
MDATNYVKIRDTEYKVEPVSKIYFRGLTECLTDLSDVDYLSKSAKTIKKVIIPTIADSIICKGDLEEEFYLWHSSVEPEEINEIILKIARCFRLQKIEEAKTKGDKAAIAEHEEGLALINQYLKPGVTELISYSSDATTESDAAQAELEALRKELKVLKSQQSD